MAHGEKARHVTGLVCPMRKQANMPQADCQVMKRVAELEAENEKLRTENKRLAHEHNQRVLELIERDLGSRAADQSSACGEGGIGNMAFMIETACACGETMYVARGEEPYRLCFVCANKRVAELEVQLRQCMDCCGHGHECRAAQSALHADKGSDDTKEA